MAKQMSRVVQADGRVHGVVVGVRREDGKWLMIRRSRHVWTPGKVCFPGGTIEVGETQEAAAVREMREELGIDVKLIERVWRYDFADKALTLWGWMAELPAGQTPVPNEQEIEEILWLSQEEGVGHVDGLPTNREFLACLSDAVKSG